MKDSSKKLDSKIRYKCITNYISNQRDKMNAETKKEVIVEYSIDIVYNTLISLFPLKYYKLQEYDYTSHSLVVIDSFNPGFIMEIDLNKNLSNTTIIKFYVNYPHAIMDLTHGGQQAIDIILEELLNKLDKQPKTSTIESNNIEVVNKENFISSAKKTHTPTIIIGYILSTLSIVLTLISLINYDPSDSTMAMIFVIGILCLTFEISLSVILQYYEDSKSILHGRIQLCLCGITLIILGIIIHPSLIIGGILIPLVALTYFLKREKESN